MGASVRAWVRACVHMCVRACLHACTHDSWVHEWVGACICARVHAWARGRVHAWVGGCVPGCRRARARVRAGARLTGLHSAGYGAVSNYSPVNAATSIGVPIYIDGLWQEIRLQTKFIGYGAQR